MCHGHHGAGMRSISQHFSNAVTPQYCWEKVKITLHTKQSAQYDWALENLDHFSTCDWIMNCSCTFFGLCKGLRENAPAGRESAATMRDCASRFY